MGGDSVIIALKSALEQDPDNDEIRLHLADLLLADNQFEAADQHYSAIMQREPANLRALRGCASTAAELGQPERAESCRKILQALGGEPDSPADAEAPAALDNVTDIAPPAHTDSTPTSPDDDDHEPRLRVVDSGANVAQGPWEDPEPVITLADVGGMESVKKRLNNAFLAPLKNPELVKMYKKSLSGGLMLYGPPGCGKTFIARALAGELGAGFMSIGLSDVLDMWLGESERKLHELFENARRNAPTVLFIDEIDALGQKRSQQRHSAGRNVVNQLLTELDSVGSENRSLFVLSATNHPWDVDAALKRPGRFDRTILVLPPDGPARESILAYHMSERPSENLQLERIAQQTDQYSGADPEHLCESAVEAALEASIESGEARPVLQADFDAAIAQINPSTRAWFDTAKNYAMFANEGGIYDELLAYIQANRL